MTNKRVTMGRKLVFLFLSILVHFGSKAQTAEENIRSEFDDYMITIINEEFEKSVEYLDEDFLKIIPKEQMIQVMEQTINNPDIEFEFLENEINEIGEVENINEKYYSLIEYNSVIKMKFLTVEQEGQTQEEIDLTRDLIKLQLEKSFGEGNVDYNEETKFYTLNATKKACAISKNGESEWKFVVLEPDQKAILEQFLPQEIVDSF